MNSTLIISDIDGTLVAHPFLSRQSVQSRQAAAMRLFSLFEYRNFGLITGRTLVGFERFFQEYNVPRVYPNFLGVEFATHLAVAGNWIKWQKNDQELQVIIADFEKILEKISEFQVGHDVARDLQNGNLSTYFVELKSICAQIEFKFPDDNLNEKFKKILAYHINHKILLSNNLVLQPFFSNNRLDIIKRDFVPKTGFWEPLKEHWSLLGLPESKKVKLVLLGDELYDSYMFYYGRKVLADNFAEVYLCSVGHALPWATHVIPSTGVALDIVEVLLKDNKSDPGRMLGQYQLESGAYEDASWINF